MPLRIAHLFQRIALVTSVTLFSSWLAPSWAAGGTTFGALPIFTAGGPPLIGYPHPGDHFGPTSMFIADLNTDGQPDIVIVNDPTEEFYDLPFIGVALGKGDGTFQAASSYSSGGENSLAVATGDLNGDGHIDVAVTNCAPAGGSCDGTVNGVVSVLLNAAGSH